jgi:fumarate reductase subunit D
MLVHSLADFNLHIPANAAWFAALAGIATTAQASQANLESEVSNLKSHHW